ncbi:MAG: ABC transporter ATP-binding protein, partial [Trueperaceae bacterium]|nr:ABC transporter ATP-binding protein [Trueperaceae bacterium]
MIRRFFAYYKPYKRLFAVDFGSAVISGMLELGFPIVVLLFIDNLLPSGNWTSIAWASAGLAALYFLNTGLMAVVTYWGHMLGVNIETDMRRNAFDHLQKLSFGFYDNQKTGHLVGRLTKDLEEIGEVAHHGPEDVFIAVMTVIGAAVLMLSVNAQLALITLAILPFTGWLTTKYGGRMTQTWRDLFSRVGA